MSQLVKIVPPEQGYQVVGIKKAPSKDGTKVYVTYYAIGPWSDYELSRDDYGLSGYPVQEFQTTEDFNIHLGDVVKFYYGRAVGSYQPIVDFKLLVPYAGTPDKK